MTTSYQEVAAAALAILGETTAIPHSPELTEEFLRCIALLTDAGHVASVPIVLEFVDARQHLLLNPVEAAGAIQFLSACGLIEQRNLLLVIPDSIWSKVPRKRGKIDGSAGGLIRWQALIKNQCGK